MSDMSFILAFVSELNIPKDLKTKQYAKYFKKNGIIGDPEYFDDDGRPCYEFKNKSFIPYYDREAKSWQFMYIVEYVRRGACGVEVNLDLQSLHPQDITEDGDLDFSDDIRIVCHYWYNGSEMPTVGRKAVES